MEHFLKEVEAFARAAHGSQTRKYTDELYINHPIRVKDKCHQYNQDLVVLAAALLHDVLEDTPVKEEELKDFLFKVIPDASLAVRIATVVVELTDTFIKVNYPTLNRRQRKELEAKRLSSVSYEAQTVKYADIIDNTDIATHDRHFAVVFLREVEIILSLMKQGNPELRKEAVDLVNQCMQKLKIRPSLHS